MKYTRLNLVRNDGIRRVEVAVESILQNPLR